MSEEITVNLEAFTPEELIAAIKAKRKIEKYQKKSLLEQLIINIKNKGYTWGTIAALVAGGGFWQKEKILKIVSPPISITQQEIAEANSTNLLMAKEMHILANDHDKKLDKIYQKMLEIDNRLEEYLNQGFIEEAKHKRQIEQMSNYMLQLRNDIKGFHY